MRRTLSYIIFSFIALVSYSQSISDLNNEKEELLNKISYNSELIKEFTEKRQNELRVIGILDNKISKRKRLLEVYIREMAYINKQISNLNYQVDSLEKTVHSIRDEYAKIIYQMYINKLGRNDLCYILSASSFNESYRRFMYLSQYNDYRKNQSVILSQKLKECDSIKVIVEDRKKTVTKLLQNINEESKNIELEMKERQAKVTDFKSRESELVAENKIAQKNAQNLELRIMALIKEEAEKNKKGKALKSNIAENKGKLPWPSKDGILVGEFGEHEHPIIKTLKIRNNGIDIDMMNDPKVYCVFDGEVSRVIAIPGYNATVIVRHGSVLTVYANLVNVMVKADKKIKTGTQLGEIYRGESSNSNILHFEVWNEDEKQNPLIWLEKH